METLVTRYANLKKKIGGNREQQYFEDTFGMPREEQLYITMPGKDNRRIISELDFAIRLSAQENGKYDDLISEALTLLETEMKNEGVITRSAGLKAEEIMMPISAEAKEYELMCAAHAHIDMNWMWTWHETVAATLSTFRTMLNLMNQYPEFTFSQSQASVYHIVEKYDPEMKKEIEARIQEGRWEVTATAWVETDKNMPSSESLMRHIRMTRDYLKKNWNVPDEMMEIDFSPDTFGHSGNIPEIDTYGDVKYMYHCRALNGDQLLYRWKSISGKEILVYREPYWYNSAITPRIGAGLMDRVKQGCGLKTGFVVYGVGNHGGGPSRRDIERILEMREWPIWPKMSFGTFREFFRRAEAVREKLPFVEGEINFAFPGCYTTQARIKQGNREAENALITAETFSALAGVKVNEELYTDAWRRVLFTHFHDILTGSCTPDSRDYAMAQYYEAAASTQTIENKALIAFSDKIDSSMFIFDSDIEDSQSEGAGVGYGLLPGIPNPERGAGKTRVYHVFNPCNAEKDEAVEITLWDWTGNLRQLCAIDENGNELPMQRVDGEMQDYWAHKFVRVLVRVKVPALGYASIALTEKEEKVYPAFWQGPIRCTAAHPPIVLENEFIRAVIRPTDGAIISYVDKAAGTERIKAGEAACLTLSHCEIPSNNAWEIGRRMKKEALTDMVEMQDRSGGSVRKSVTMKHRILNSSVKTTVSLDAGARALKCSFDIDWNERSKQQFDFVPVLNFDIPLADDTKKFHQDVPAGYVERTGEYHDVSANSHSSAILSDGRALTIVSDGRYGYTIDYGTLGITLVNTSTGPDPMPERCQMKTAIYIAATGAGEAEIAALADSVNRPAKYVSATIHKAELPAKASVMQVESNSCRMSAVFREENAMVVRLYETEGKKDSVKVSFPFEIEKAELVSLMGNKLDQNVEVCGNTASFDLEAFNIAAVKAYPAK